MVGVAVVVGVGVVVVVGVVVGVVVVNRAFARAEQARRRYKPATPAQRRTLRRWAKVAGLEVPTVRWRHEASDALCRLERIVRQPTLGPM